MLGVLLPPVVAGLVPERREIADGQADRRRMRLERDAVPLGVLRECPQPRAVAVELKLPPLLRRLASLHGVAAGKKLLGRDVLAARLSLEERLDTCGTSHDHASTPCEEGVGAVGTADTAHGVGGECAVSEPAVSVDGEVR